jgi:hypothetical protein
MASRPGFSHVARAIRFEVFRMAKRPDRWRGMCVNLWKTVPLPNRLTTVRPETVLWDGRGTAAQRLRSGTDHEHFLDRHNDHS